MTREKFYNKREDGLSFFNLRVNFDLLGTTLRSHGAFLQNTFALALLLASQRSFTCWSLLWFRILWIWCLPGSRWNSSHRFLLRKLLFPDRLWLWFRLLWLRLRLRFWILFAFWNWLFCSPSSLLASFFNLSFFFFLGVPGFLRSICWSLLFLIFRLLGLGPFLWIFFGNTGQRLFFGILSLSLWFNSAWVSLNVFGFSVNFLFFCRSRRIFPLVIST